MFNRNRNRNFRFNNDNGFFSSMPLFFKIWFLFIFTIVITIFAVTGYSFYAVLSNPDATTYQAGHLLGQVNKGFNEGNN